MLGSEKNFHLPPLQNNHSSYNTQNIILENENDENNSNFSPIEYSYIPFRFPKEEEDIIKFYESEKQKKQNKYLKLQEQKIWDKRTNSSNQILKHFKNYKPQFNESCKYERSFKDNEKKLIQSALDVAKERLKESNKMEYITDIIKQKKEIFLITMSHGILEKEIESIKKQSLDRQQAIVQSEKILQQDYDKFQKYLDLNKQQKLNAEFKADEQNKIKKQKEATIKEINLKITSMKSEKSRNEESLQNYKEHKEFLDKIAPKEWEEEKQKKRAEFINELKKNWMNKYMDMLEKQYKQSRSSIINDKSQKLQIQKKLESQFQSLLQKNELEEIEDFDDNYPMFFNNHNQLIDCFNILEEKNLFLIQMKQEEFSNLEEFKNKFRQQKQHINSQLKNLNLQKDQLKKQIDETNNSIKSLRQNYENESTLIVDKNEIKIRNILIDFYGYFKEEINLHDVESKKTLDILTVFQKNKYKMYLILNKQVEILLEKQLNDIDKCPTKLVEEKRKKAEKQRKFDYKEVQKRLKVEDFNRRKLKNQQKMTQQSRKKTGRIVMSKSSPFLMQINKEVKVQRNIEEGDSKYFRQDYTLI